MLPIRDDGLGACGPLADQLRSFARFCRAQTYQPAEGCAFADGVKVVRWLDQMRKASADSHRALPVSLLSVTTWVHGDVDHHRSWRDSCTVGRRQYMHSVHAAPASRALPVTVLSAAESGPTVLLLAGLGGDEAEGMAALQHVLASVQVDENDAGGVGMNPLVRGRIVAVNCCNLDGYDLGCGSRYAASDGLDLAHSFPGTMPLSGATIFQAAQLGLRIALVCTGMMEGSITQRVAYTLTSEFIAHADFIATIHSGGDSGAFQIAPVAGFLKPQAQAPGAPLPEHADAVEKLASQRSQQQQACTDCKMSAGVWAVDCGSGTVQETAENLGVSSMFVAAAGALGGGAHSSNHDALGLVRSNVDIFQFVQSLASCDLFYNTY